MAARAIAARTLSRRRAPIATRERYPSRAAVVRPPDIDEATGAMAHQRRLNPPARRALVLLALAVACHPMARPAYPLYPKIDAGPGPDKVALLRGPIALVDGARVSGKGPTFELLPGCHVVELERNVGGGSDNGGWSASLPRMIYAFEMRPAHLYTVETRADMGSGPRGKLRIIAEEHAPDGSVVLVPRARGSDVSDCQHWAASQGY